ncbi:MAG TPA: phosphohydrolase [Halanaerobiaceae bacterium]|jgi:predicted phosphohydrolase|nr:metallophosphoesterase [Bacillota bacterium]HHU92310.1 phosphohydrolase [Halanaerobiaceae bacterium]HOA41512.1 metallophosphoesterase [Halanaerobiales bacterium]HPZ62277.1 metallophosphoesterase [Halanaerobiales bacterium]HQD03567.1 metallophosphoesterase [Halanaerobiales bacterium]
MKVYAISDLHLSFKNKVVPGKWQEVEEYKPMNIFGEKWEKHYYRLYKNWLETVQAEDLVLLPGDISWASTGEELGPDLDFISHLPGKKIFVKGNHDYWWQGIGQLRTLFPEDSYLIQNDSISFGKIAIAGSRGWIVPNNIYFTERDEKIYKRELIRLQLSLDSLDKKAECRIAMLHYMPVNEEHQHNEIIDLLESYKIDICIYGHLHGEEAHANRLEGNFWGIDFHLVSADFLDFTPIRIL